MKNQVVTGNLASETAASKHRQPVQQGESDENTVVRFLLISQGIIGEYLNLTPSQVTLNPFISLVISTEV